MTAETTPALTLTSLKKGFVSPEGERRLVVDIPRFSMAPGEHLALRGPSGSGKTTLLNLISGLLQPDVGQVVLAGREITSLSEAARDRVRAVTLGYVFQTFNLLQAYSALENVELGMLFGPGPDPAYARQLLTRVGLQDRLSYKPRQLSVGQQQRVALARALANRPRLVLADEPTANLDPQHAREALALIRQVCGEERAALLIVSHDPESLSMFPRVLDLREVNRAAAAFLPDAGGEGLS